MLVCKSVAFRVVFSTDQDPIDITADYVFIKDGSYLFRDEQNNTIAAVNAAYVLHITPKGV